MATTQTRENGRVKPRQLESLEDYLIWVEELTLQGQNLEPLTRGLLEEKFRLQTALDEVREIHLQLREEIASLTAAPLFPVIITDVSTKTSRFVEVFGAGMQVYCTYCCTAAGSIPGRSGKRGNNSRKSVATATKPCGVVNTSLPAPN